MVLWVIFAALTGLAVLAVLAPLTRVRVSPVSDRDSDIAVYKDQLREIDADLDRGVVEPADAEAARIEVSRRLLAADHATSKAASGGRPLPRVLVVAVIVLIPLISLGIYLSFGSPGMPGQPLSARLEKAPQNQDLNVLVARVEEHLAAEPEDGQGWAVLGPVYMRSGRFDDAAQAFANTIRLLGSTAALEADYGEALVAAGDGMVSQEARAAFERALADDPGFPKARFFMATAAEQDGDVATAVTMWRELLADTPPDAPWRQSVTQRLTALGEDAGEGAAVATMGSGPSAEDVAAAQAMSADERTEMISGMVDRLASRLAEDGRDLDGWLKLARAYVVLGEPDKARQALSSARDNYRDDVGAGARIDEAAGALGLGSS